MCVCVCVLGVTQWDNPNETNGQPGRNPIGSLDESESSRSLPSHSKGAGGEGAGGSMSASASAKSLPSPSSKPSLLRPAPIDPNFTTPPKKPQERGGESGSEASSRIRGDPGPVLSLAPRTPPDSRSSIGSNSSNSSVRKLKTKNSDYIVLSVPSSASKKRDGGDGNAGGGGMVKSPSSPSALSLIHI